MPGWYPLPDQENFDYAAIQRAYEQGDMEGLKAALHDPEDFPNNHSPAGFGEPLIQAIYSSPLPFIVQLLELGADPNLPVLDGFPPLIAAVMSERKDVYEVVEILLKWGANVQQRGINGWFPLHCAVARDDERLVEILLEHGADLDARTDVDDYSTSLEDAEQFGKTRAAKAIRDFMGRAR